MLPGWVEVGVLILVVLTGGLLLLFCFLIWRDGYIRGWRQARHRPPQCPSCGYMLSGLTHCRCPECGSEYRIDQLWQTALLSRNPVKHEENEGNSEILRSNAESSTFREAR